MAKPFSSPFTCEVRRTGGYPYYDSNGLTQNSHTLHGYYSSGYFIGGEDYVPKAKDYPENWYLYSIVPEITFTGGTIIDVHNYGDSGYGITVLYEFDYLGDTYRVRYAHLNQIFNGIEVGRHIYSNQPVGIAGETGNVKGRHLHIEVLVSVGLGHWESVKPSDYVNFDMKNTAATTIIKPSGAKVVFPEYLSYTECNKENKLFKTPGGSFVHIVKNQNTNTDNLTDYYIVTSTFDPYYFNQKVTEIVKNAITMPTGWTEEKSTTTNPMVSVAGAIIIPRYDY